MAPPYGRRLPHPIVHIPHDGILPSRVFRAAVELNQSALDPKQGASVDDIKSTSGSSAPEFDLIDSLIKDNQKLWDEFIDNTFCADLAKLADSLTPSFKYYSIQDYLYLVNLIRFDAFRAAKAPTIPEVVAQAAKVAGSNDYAEEWKQTCITSLQITESDFASTAEGAATAAYTEFESGVAEGEDWFTIHVVMIPCIQGYLQIAQKLDADPSTNKDSLFYKYWIAPNLDTSYVKSQRDFINANIAHYLSPSEMKDWNAIFVKACQNEINLFASATKVTA